MVGFGAHLAASRVDGWEDAYVDFDSLRELATNPETNPQRFAELWRAELQRCAAKFDQLSRDGLRELFSRRATNGLAARVYLQLPGLCKSVNRGYAESFTYGEFMDRRHESVIQTDVEVEDALELQSVVIPLFEQRRSFGLLNVEALRKLAKKLEKYVCPDTALELYMDITCSTMANAVCTDFTNKLRELVSEIVSRNSHTTPQLSSDIEVASNSSTPSDEEPTAPQDSALTKRHSRSNKRGSVRRTNSRSSSQSQSPFGRLCVLVKSLDLSLKRKLVSHRGFHSTADELHRPLENTLTAYEQAWASGINYCECDITLTLDGRLVLCHDSDLRRLAHDPDNTHAFLPVTELTLDQVSALPLKNGTHAPLLEEVLRTAVRTGPHSGLVIEIKSGADSGEVAAVLCRLLVENPVLLQRVSVVMSFDMYIIHNFKKFFDAAFENDMPPNAPKILLLTRNWDSDGTELEMALNWDHDTPEATSDQIYDYLVQNGSRLDGIYMQFHESLVEESSPSSRLVHDLCGEFVVGVWGSREDPDTLENAVTLSDLGISFINTDLPDDFSPTMDIAGVN